MKTNEPTDDRDLSFEAIEKLFVLPLNHSSKREVILANMDGRYSYMNMDTGQILVMPYREGTIKDLDSDGKVFVKEYELDAAQRSLHDALHRYMIEKEWAEHLVECPPYDIEDPDTKRSIVEACENMLLSWDPEDHRADPLRDILESNPDPAHEIIFNIRRQDIMHLFNRHFLVWEIASMDEQLRYYFQLHSRDMGEAYT